MIKTLTSDELERIMTDEPIDLYALSQDQLLALSQLVSNEGLLWHFDNTRITAIRVTCCYVSVNLNDPSDFKYRLLYDSIGQTNSAVTGPEPKQGHRKMLYWSRTAAIKGMLETDIASKENNTNRAAIDNARIRADREDYKHLFPEFFV